MSHCCRPFIQNRGRYVNHVVIQENPVIMQNTDKTVRVECAFTAEDQVGSREAFLIATYYSSVNLLVLCYLVRRLCPSALWWTDFAARTAEASASPCPSSPRAPTL